MSDDPHIRVERGDDRYEIFVDDASAGVTAFFIDEEGRTVFPHTKMDPAFAGRGLASTLVGQALEAEAARGATIVPLCPFVVKYLKKHDVPGLEVDWP